MATDVDICNLALGLLGDSANVTSINPPDQSVQAGHCSRFYPIARDALLEMHTWGFATTRVSLAQVATNPTSTWQYAYAVPTDALNLLEIIDPNASDDYSVGLQLAMSIPTVVQAGVGVYQSQPFAVENDLILTNQQNAVLRYTQTITDTSQFSPLFVNGLSVLLASYLAGPLIKGQEGRNAAQQMQAAFFKWKEYAVESDSNQRSIKPMPGAAWMVNR